MNVYKTYPEAHDAWLKAMGIGVRWHYRMESQVTDGNPSPDIELPAVITQARYWLMGEEVLTPEYAYLLAGLLWAIQADVKEVIYSEIAERSTTQLTNFPTALSAWPQLNTLSLSQLSSPQLTAVLDQNPELRIWVLGNDVLESTHAVHERLLYLPSLAEMKAQPLKKQTAWLAVKSLRG